MNTTLTSQQISDYQRDGFVAHRGLLDADEISTLKAAVLDAIGTLGNRKVAGKGADLTDGDGSYYDKVFTQKLNLALVNETVKSFMYNSAIGKMLCDLEDVNGFRVWHDQALIKEPYGNPTGWHLDNPYWSFFSKNAISIWIALEDATPQNGCMYFVPGSHELASYKNASIGKSLSDLFDVYPEMTKTDPVGVPMKAGDCSFHNGLTAHGAGANMTRQRRIAMTCAYMPVGSTYNGQQNILSDDYVKTLEVGQLMEDDVQNPLVYMRESVSA